MADISVERKPRSRMGLILAIVLLAAIAAGVWWWMNQNGAAHSAADAPAAPAATQPANP